MASFDLETLSWDILKNLEGLKLAGGEILMMPQHVDLLKKLIKEDVAKNIELMYIVNVMHVTYHNSSKSHSKLFNGSMIVIRNNRQQHFDLDRKITKNRPNMK